LSNSQVHKIKTRQTYDLYVPTANLAIYQKGVYYSGIKIYDHLPTAIKDLSGDKNKFKLALKRYILHNSFYCLEEYFSLVYLFSPNIIRMTVDLSVSNKTLKVNIN